MTIVDVATLLVDVYRYGLIFVVAGLLFTFKYINRLHRFLLGYMVLMLAIELSSKFLARIFGTNHMILPFFALIELCFFAYFYHTFFLSKKFRRIFLPPFVAAILLIVIEFFYYFTLHTANPHVYQPYSKIADNLIVLGMAFVTLKDTMLGSAGYTSYETFWFNVVIILYFTFDTVFFLPFNFMVNAPTDIKFAFWMSHTFSLIGFYGFISTRIFRNALSSAGAQA